MLNIFRWLHIRAKLISFLSRFDSNPTIEATFVTHSTDTMQKWLQRIYTRFWDDSHSFSWQWKDKFRIFPRVKWNCAAITGLKSIACLLISFSVSTRRKSNDNKIVYLFIFCSYWNRHTEFNRIPNLNLRLFTLFLIHREIFRIRIQFSFILSLPAHFVQSSMVLSTLVEIVQRCANASLFRFIWVLCTICILLMQIFAQVFVQRFKWMFVVRSSQMQEHHHQEYTFTKNEIAGTRTFCRVRVLIIITRKQTSTSTCSAWI